MRRVISAAAMAASLAACGSDSTGPAKFDPQTLVGVWEVTPDSAWSCWTGKPYLWFLVTQDDAGRFQGGSLNVFSTWSRDPDTVEEGRSITGHFNTNANTATFRLWWRAGELFADLSGELNGTVIRGQLTAPKGMASAWVDCRSNATAKRL